MPPDDFHACALAAFVDVASECGAWPDSEAVRVRAYEYYESRPVIPKIPRCVDGDF